MKLILLKFCKSTVCFLFLENLSNGINIYLAEIFDMDKNVIKINNDKNDKFFSQDFTDTTLNTGQNIKKSKNYHLILELAILSLESYLLFIILLDPYVIVNNSEIMLY